MDVKITDASTLTPKDITILGDPDASTITLSDPTTTITVATDQLTVTSSTETLNDIGDVNITSVADNQTLVYDSGTSKWINEAQSGTGTVTSIAAGTGLSGGTITGSGTIAIDSTVATLTGSQALTNKTGAISQWTNDSSYITASSSTALTNKTGAISQWTNDSSYLTSVPAQSFSSLTGKPTTLSGYGITDGYTDAKVLTKINATDLDALSDVHTATPTDGQVLTWDNTNSYWKPATSSTAPVTSVNSLTGVVVLNTANVSEVTNLYYTDTRARGAVSVTTGTAGNLSALAYDSGTGVLTFTPADASTKMPLTGGAFTGAVTTNSTFDGVDIAVRDGVLTTTTTTANTANTNASTALTNAATAQTTANAALPKAGGTMSGAIAMGSQKITGLGTPTANDDATSKTYVDTAVSGGGGAVTSYTNSTDNRVITSGGGTIINGEANFTFDGSNALLSGSAGGLTGPVLELVTDNSGWNRPLIMLTDSNGDVASVGGEHNTGSDAYTYNFTFDPNNTHGRTGATTWGGDYYVAFAKNYSDQSEISIDMNVYGAHNGFNIAAFDDFNSNSVKYTAKPINLKGNEINLYSSDTSTPFGNFTKRLTVRADAVDVEVDIALEHTKALNFDNAGTVETTIDKDEISAKGSFKVNVDSDNSGNESFVVQSAGTDALTINRGPGGDAETTIKGDGVFIKDDAGSTQFSMDMSSASQTGINVFRTDENKSLALSLKTDDTTDTGSYNGTWAWQQAADTRKVAFEYSGTVIYEVRDSADVATAVPTDIVDFKVPVVFPSYLVAALPTTVVAGAQAFCTNETGGAVNVFFDGTSWRRCTDRAVAS